MIATSAIITLLAIALGTLVPSRRTRIVLALLVTLSWAVTLEPHCTEGIEHVGNRR